MKKYLLILMLLLTACGTESTSPFGNHLGIFLFYRPTMQETSTSWNDAIDSFDVPTLVSQLKEVNAGYVLLVIGQHTGFFLSPNKVYDEASQTTHTSHRDLVAELATQLHKNNISLFIYVPTIGPIDDPAASSNVGFNIDWRAGECTGMLCPQEGSASCIQSDCSPNNTFHDTWLAVLSEWASRWGSNIDGWFMDESYDWNPISRQEFYNLLKKHNPNTLITFNPGFQCNVVVTEPSDFSSGEAPDPGCAHRDINFPLNTPFHVTSYLGSYWGEGEIPRFSKNFVESQTNRIIQENGNITWDIPLTRRGTLKQKFINLFIN
jgi:hypothetical protein